MLATGAISRVKLKRRFCPARSSRSLGSSLQRNDAGVWLCEYPGLSFQRSPVCACSLVSSLLLSGATMSQQSSLTQSARSVRQVLTAYTPPAPEGESAPARIITTVSQAHQGAHPVMRREAEPAAAL